MTSSTEGAVTGVRYKGSMGATDYRLGRFVLEQNEPSFGHDTYDHALQQLRDGRKHTHWMWYVFPQLEFGSTATSKKFSLSGLDEARAYLAHPTLRDRLHQCTDAVLASEAPSATALVGHDAAKLRSSMTLFLRAEPEDPRYQAVLDKYFDGKPDAATDERLGLA